MDAESQQQTPDRREEVTLDFLAGLETPVRPGGLPVVHRAVEDAAGGSGGKDPKARAGSAPVGELTAEGSTGGNTKGGVRPNSRMGVPNYQPSEAAAAVWAYIAMSEYKAIQPMVEQLKRIAVEYPKKAKQLALMGKWSCSRTVEESAALRTTSPQSIYGKAKKVMETIQSSITPVWHQVVAEQRSGWGTEDFVRETKIR